MKTVIGTIIPKKSRISCYKAKVLSYSKIEPEIEEPEDDLKTTPGKILYKPALPKYRPPKLIPSKVNRIWDNYIELGEIQKADHLKLSVGLAVRDGVRCFTLRDCYFSKGAGTWRLSEIGINIPLRIPVDKGTRIITPYQELIELLAAGVDQLEAMELYDENSAAIVIGDKRL